ncbi:MULTISPECIES: hypothetical protein [unclassified Methylobacterium]|uniref:hypothetical protein n=1 Tax=unclassified Methylobacterium TaxID=2615210 RepID=UPI0013548322|nr:hypothetical protein [Methylobacterium sp. 2A]MWV24966.1 hypothetical protein [Methylobacterium sp. 2A]
MAAAMGLITARWLGWGSVVVIALILAVAVGLEGAVESRTLFKVMKRGLEINSTFQGSYLAMLCVLHGKRLLDARK